jgi:hypothetical protein
MNPATTRPGNFVQLSVGRPTTCAIDVDAQLWCWSVGDPAVPIGGSYVKLSISDDKVCSISTDGMLACSQCFYDGSFWCEPCLGSDSTSGECGWLAEQPAGTFTDVAVGLLGACAVRTDGSVACWGDSGLTSELPPELAGSP